MKWEIPMIKAFSLNILMSVLYICTPNNILEQILLWKYVFQLQKVRVWIIYFNKLCEINTFDCRNLDNFQYQLMRFTSRLITTDRR